MENIEKLISLCDELIGSKILFADKKISKILEIIAATPELYELMSDCLSDFDKGLEFKLAFKNEDGKSEFVMPEEEFKVLALVFCLMADINNGKIDLDELAHTYFKDESGRIDTEKLMQTIFVPFRNLIMEAFGSSEEEEKYLPLSQEQLDNLSPEDKLKILPFPIERTMQYIRNPEGIYNTFIAAKETALQMIERLEEEKSSPVSEDVTLMLNCVLIACIDQEFDLLVGLVKGLKYACRTLKPLRHYMRELTEIIDQQIRKETR